MTAEQNERNAQIVERLYEMRASTIRQLKVNEIDCEEKFQDYVARRSSRGSAWLEDSIKSVETLRVLIERFDEILDNKE